MRLFRLLLSLLVLATIAAPGFAQNRTNPPGLLVDRQDTGLRGSSFHTEDMSPGQRNVCRELCRENPICKGYNWTKKNESRGPRCTLYHFVFETVATPYVHSGRRSGVRLFNGTREAETRIKGDVYKTLELPQNKPKMCRDACALEGTCRAYAYFKPGTHGAGSPATCELMTTVEERIRNRGCCVSGARAETFQHLDFLPDRKMQFRIPRTEPVANLPACIDLCEGDETCNYLRYRKTTATDPLGECQLSNSRPVAISTDTGYTSYARESSATRMYGAKRNVVAEGPSYQKIYLDTAPGDGPELCRAACGLDDECRDANYVSAGSPGESAVCNLKSAPTPSRRNDDCCTTFSKIPNTKPAYARPGSVPTRLRFSENSRFRVIEGDRYPQDMPNVRFPVDWQGCSADDRYQIRRAWARAHYNVWRATQVLSHLRRHPRRKDMWAWSFNDRMGTEPRYNNITPRAYFGSYDAGRFDTVRRVVDKLFHERFRGKTFKVKCRLRRSDGAHPCETFSGVNANHFIYGSINICRSWFQKENFNDRVTVLTHEMLHWLKIPESNYWVTDNHDFWRSCRKYRAVRPLYDDDAVWLGMNRGCRDWNHNRAVRVNDTYAWWTTMLGDRIYSRRLPQFPAEDF